MRTNAAVALSLEDEPLIAIQTKGIGSSFVQPAQQHGQPPVDPIDIVRRDFHGRTWWHLTTSSMHSAGV